ncbi:MAG: aldo/keto reductase [Chloroflexota bacterium]
MIEHKDDRGAARAGTVRLGGDLSVRRMAYGAMRLPGPRVWGEPADPEAARSVVRRAIELGVNLIDTAGYYGAHVADRIIAQALHPYPDDLVLVSKVGAARGDNGSWTVALRPEEIRSEVEGDLLHLRVEQLHLVHCRYMDESAVPLEESVGALAELRAQGKIRHIGLSSVSLEQVLAVRDIVPVVSIQNQYSVSDRAGEDVLDFCTQHGVVFMPFFPLGVGKVARAQGALRAVAERHGATTTQIALAWLLARSPMMVPIPGTSSLAHLEENVAAAAITLTGADMRELDAAG